jgi:transposase
MGMGTRKGQGQQEDIWMVSSELARTPGHPFYQRLNELLDGERFGEFVEGLCRKFDAPRYGRPSLAPGIYFRSLLIGYFEGIDSERGIAWRLADSLALRQFVRIGLTEQTPDHSTISRTRRLIDLDTHRAVFDWVLRLLSDRGLIQGNRVGIDATALEANTGVPGDRSSSLGWKTEHAVDMDTGAVVAVTLQEADKGDTTTLNLTLSEAGVAVAEL